MKHGKELLQTAMDACPEQFSHDPVHKMIWVSAFLVAYRMALDDSIYRVEPEYEYGWRLTESDNGDFCDESVSSDEIWSTPEEALAQAQRAKFYADSEELPPLAITVLERTKVGPWRPLPATNERNKKA